LASDGAGARELGRCGCAHCVAEEVEDEPDAQTVELNDVSGGEPLEAVGAVDAPPAHLVSTDGLVAAEIAEVDRSFELEAAWGVVHALRPRSRRRRGGSPRS